MRIVAGDHLLTVNPVDGSEIEPCPPGERRARPERRDPDEQAELRRAAAAPRPSGTVLPELPMLERDEERERLARLLARGRSVRVTGPSGSGRSTLLDAVASDCERLAPDGVVRLTGYHRTPTDLLHDLYAAVFSAPLYRPDRAELLESVQEVGAVVVLDDIEFGGAALDEFLDATPECAFLISATPDVPAPSADSHLEEAFLSGLSRTAGLDLLERAARRPLAEDEASWAADLWFESEGLPLRFVQAGALLRQREALGDDASAREADGGSEAPLPLPSIAEAASPAALLAGPLGEAAQDALRFAVALGGECPHQAHLPALSADTHAEAALGELLGCGLVTPAGSHYRLAARVTAQLAEAGYADEDAGRAHTVAGHYAWWAGHPSVAPERVAAEADAILAALTALIGSREAGHADAAVLLARAAAPAFAAALHWGAWERTVRHGQEAARLAGQVADEAYFHHELGVLALCTGNLDRARAELEASIGLRGVLADKRGTVAGRRALALVADRSPGSAMAGAFGASGGNRKGGDEPSAAGAAPDDTATTIVTPKVAATTPMAALGDPATTAVTAAVPAASRPAVTASTAPTALVGASAAASGPAGPSGGSGGPGGKPRGPRRPAMRGTRRNVVAAAAGVLLVAVLGTVVTLGATSGDDSHNPADKVKPGRSASQRDDDKGLTADEPTSGTSQAPQPGLSGTPLTSTSPTAPSDSASPSDSTESGGPSSTSGTPSDTERPPSPPSSDPTTSDPRPTTKPPTSKPPTPTGEPTKPTPTTSSPTTTPTDDTSTTASAPTTHTAPSTASPVA
ncbi:hypothetical protein CFP59_03290 [Streptomyces malaysiensis subsp. malaysiensis]|uniref:ATP-binding protein n=1 Tax=Streptomyces malaysiensis TaxID=92644 RepID=UPI000CA2DBF0|nr:ATP-binding protein [Streptomyces sp. M56]AUA11180.1 hypothetical protein CFP59_03290 [Streptomyces sp. M56]